MLEVVHGDVEALEGDLLEQVRAHQARKGEGPLLVVVPSAPLLRYLRRLLARRLGGLWDVHFLTFFGLARRIVEEEGLPGPVVPDSVLEELLRHLGERLEGGEEAWLSRVLVQRGGAGALRATLRDLREAGVPPARLIEVARELDDPLELDRVRRLAVAAGVVEEVLSRAGLVDRYALSPLAAERAARSSFLERARGILYYGFYDLTRAQLDLLGAIARARPTRVSLLFEAERSSGAYRFARKLFQEVTSLLPGASIRELAPPRVSWVRRLFAEGADPESPPRVTRIRVSGTENEAWMAAKRVLEMVEVSGLSLDEIAVVARSLDATLDPVTRALDREGIPWRSPATRSALHLPVLQAVRRLLSLPRRRFHRRLVVECLESLYLDWGRGFGGRPPDVASIDRLSRRRGVGWGIEEWERAFAGEEADVLRPRLLEWMRAVEAAFGTAEAGAAGWRAQVEGLVEALFSFLRLDPLPAGDPQAEVVADLREELLALGLLDRLGVPARREAFLRAADAVIEGLGVRASDPSRGGVSILDVMQARGLKFRGVVLLGLNEGVFPRPASEDPFLSDRMRLALDQVGHKIQIKREGLDEERILFALAAAGASEELTLLHQRTDDEGKPAIPSGFLDEVRRALGGAPSGADGGGSWPSGVRSLDVARGPLARLIGPDRAIPPSLLSRAEWVLAAVDRGAPIPGEAASGLPYASLLADTLRTVEALRARRGEPGPFDGVVGPLPWFWARRSEQGFSPSFLSAAAACPFQSFLQEVLGLAPLEWPEEESRFPDPRVAGDVLHAFMKRYDGRLLEEGIAPSSLSPAQRRRRLDEALDGALAESRAQHPHGIAFGWALLADRFREWLPLVLARDVEDRAAEGWTPLAVEAPSRGALEGRVDGRDVVIPFAGRLDRVEVDAAGRGLRVTDWKYTETTSARSGNVLLRVERLQELQLPVYLLLAPRIERASPEASVREARLVRIAPNQASLWSAGERLSGEFWRSEAGDQVRADLWRFLEALREGTFPIRPEEGERGRCNRCPVRPACRRGHWPSRGRAARAALVRRLDELGKG